MVHPIDRSRWGGAQQQVLDYCTVGAVDVFRFSKDPPTLAREIVMIVVSCSTVRYYRETLM